MSEREFRIEMRSNPSPDPRDPWPTNCESRESCHDTCRDETLSDADATRDGEGSVDAVRRARAVRVIHERQGG